MDASSPPQKNVVEPTNKVRKFKIGDKYIAASKEGLIIGKLNKSGRHITLLGDGKRTTLHVTDPKSNTRENIFSGNMDDPSLKDFNAQMDEIITRFTPKRHPKYVYALPKSSFRLDLKLSDGGKVATVKPSTFRNMLHSLVRMQFEDFLKSDSDIAYTSHGTEILKGSKGYIIFYRKSNKKVTEFMLKNPFFAALEKARNKF